MTERRLVRPILVMAALMSLALGMVLVWSQTAKAALDDGLVVVAQESPYQPPELTRIDLPSWAVPFEPVARLPLWAQAALASAVLVSAFLIVRVIAHWAWGLFFRGGEGMGS